MGNTSGIIRDGLLLSEVGDALPSVLIELFGDALIADYNGDSILIVSPEDDSFATAWFEWSEDTAGMVGGNSFPIGTFGYWVGCAIRHTLAAKLGAMVYAEDREDPRITPNPEKYATFGKFMDLSRPLLREAMCRESVAIRDWVPAKLRPHLDAALSLAQPIARRVM